MNATGGLFGRRSARANTDTRGLDTESQIDSNDKAAISGVERDDMTEPSLEVSTGDGLAVRSYAASWNYAPGSAAIDDVTAHSPDPQRNLSGGKYSEVMCGCWR